MGLYKEKIMSDRIYPERLNMDFNSTDENIRIQSAYEKMLTEGSKVFVSANIGKDGVLKWRTEDGRTGSDPKMKADEKAIKAHLKKVLGKNVDLELRKD